MPTAARAADDAPRHSLARIHVRQAGWEHERTRKKLVQHCALAEAMRVSETTIWRVLTKELQRPGEEFIAASLAVFGESKFNELYVLRRES